MATEDDLPRIDEIYNQAVAKGFYTADINPLSSQARLKWFQKYSPENFPIYVYEKDQEVLGWTSISPYRAGREALNEVAEISFYIDFNFHSQGIGSKFVEFCLKRAPTLNKRIYFAIIIEGNQSSFGLLEKYGFEKWGYLPEVINYQGEKRGQIYMGKIVEKEK